MNYRDEAPKYYKDLTSDGIMTYFEDERTTKEELDWFKEIALSEDYRLTKNPISKFNWGKIKTAFAEKFFPEIAPTGESKNKKLTTEQRMVALLGQI